MSSRSISPPEPCTGRTGGTTPRSRRPPWTEPSGRPWSRRTSSGPQVRSSFVQFDVTGADFSLRSLLPPHVLGSVVPPVLVSAGLAVDYFNDRLYWADAKLSVIGSVRLDGSDPVVAVSGIKNSCVGKMKENPDLISRLEIFLRFNTPLCSPSSCFQTSSIRSASTSLRTTSTASLTSTTSSSGSTSSAKAPWRTSPLASTTPLTSSSTTATSSPSVSSAGAEPLPHPTHQRSSA